jgi:hypothetical protein
VDLVDLVDLVVVEAIVVLVAAKPTDKSAWSSFVPSKAREFFNCISQ